MQSYTLEAVTYATEGQIPNLEFATNARGLPDVAIFDFTKMYASENACCVLERKGRKLLLGLVGDSLLEVTSVPFLCFFNELTYSSEQFKMSKMFFQLICRLIDICILSDLT